jgi:3-deoxy-D-manno-octulosonic-acid transferase
VLVLGSCWAEDEALWLPIIMRRTHWKFVFAPHDPARAEELIGRLPQPALRSSAWPETSAAERENSRLLVVDQIGVLFGLYGGGQAVFVGGGFGQGLHNIIEPLAWGLPVAFGPQTGRHWEADDALRDGVAEKIDTLEAALRWLDQTEGQSAHRSWAQARQGALSRLDDLVGRHLKT